MDITTIIIWGVVLLIGLGFFIGIVTCILRAINDLIGKVIAGLIAMMTAIFATLLGTGLLFFKLGVI